MKRKVSIYRNATLALAAVMGVTILAAPAGAQAHSKNWKYKYNKQSNKCARYDRKQARLFDGFSDSKRWERNNLQALINKENDRNCKVTSDIVDTLVANGNFNTLTAAVGAAGLVDTLKTGEFTLFAPTDKAFAKLPAGTVEALLADIPTLQSILTYHAVSGTVPADVAKTLPSATTVNGKDVSIREGRRGTLFINDSKVVIYDIKTTNGIIHVIDTVLLPPADTVETPVTPPATPETETPPATPVVTPPTTPVTPPATPETETPPVEAQTKDIVDTLVADGRFNTLTAAVGAAGLADTLKSGEFTLFAPTDQAFAKLPAGTVEALLADIPTLSSILTYHAVSGSVSSDVAKTLPSAVTVNGQEIKISVRHGNLFINDSMVITKDIHTSNGIIHVIDTVLLPPTN